MKTTNIVILVIGILVLVGLTYLIVSSNKKDKIKQAAINSGIPEHVATAVSQSSNPAQSLRMLGVPTAIASSISSGVSINPTPQAITSQTCKDLGGSLVTLNGITYCSGNAGSQPCPGTAPNECPKIQAA